MKLTMKKGPFYSILATFALGGNSLTIQAVQKKETHQSPRPNILWVMAEDMGHDLSCYGMPNVKTPVLDKMASEGIQYVHAFCSNPISSPSRSGMMTGIHQTIIDAHNHRSNRDKPLPQDVKPFTYYLRKVGYTCILGNEQVFSKGRKIDCNFKTEPIGPYDGVTHFGLFDKYDHFTKADQPFFAQIQLKVTHRGDWWKSITQASKHPVDPKTVEMPPYLADAPKVREQWASYLDQVEHMDMEMGLLLAQLKKEHLLDNTIIFFIGDNGRCDIRGKGYLWNAGLEVPMIAWGKNIPHLLDTQMRSTLDITATILQLAHAEMPANLTGHPLFDNQGNIDSGDSYEYGARDDWDEAIDCIRSIATNRFKYIRNYMPQVGWDQHQQYLEFHRPDVHVMRTLKQEGKLNSAQLQFFADHKPYEELYDLMSDPYELHNLAEDPTYRDTLLVMRKHMEQWQAIHRDCGLEDRTTRHPSPATGIVQWVQEKHPDQWKALQRGEICEHYKDWMMEMKSAKKKASKSEKKQ